MYVYMFDLAHLLLKYLNSNFVRVIMPYDFVWAGNCNLMNIKVFTLFLPRGVHSECEVLPRYCFMPYPVPNKS